MKRVDNSDPVFSIVSSILIMVLRATVKGIMATVAMLTLYFFVLGLLSGLPYAWGEFVGFWYFIVALAVGFGVQVGLFFYLKDYIHSGRSSGKVLAVSATTSTSAMLSCCAHYAVNIVPLLGVTGLVTLVSQYQIHFFWVGLLFNTLGIAYISWKIISVQASNISEARLVGIKRRYVAVVVLAVFLFVVSGAQLILAGPDGVDEKETSPLPDLAEQTNTEGGVTVRVGPEEITNERWVFRVTLDTHSVELNDDMEKSVVLRDDVGNESEPLWWEGDPPGGHHRSGILKFEPTVLEPSAVSIYVRDVGAVEVREFVWQLN